MRTTQRTPLGAFSSSGPCTACRGTGKIIKTPCPTCRGAGQVRAPRKLTLRIPKGVDTGARLRLGGKGAGGLRGGEPGDLYVVLRVRPSDIFEREDNDLLVDVPISPFLAALGGSVDIPTPEGVASVNLPAGTPNGKLFRLRGKGVADLRGGPSGDLVARVVFEVPQRLTGKQRGAMEDLAKSFDSSNFPDAQKFASQLKTFYGRKEKLKK